MADLDVALAEVRRLRESNAALERELERWRHGVTIEGDFVCPNALAADLAQAELRRLRAEVERARKKADDYERDWYIAKSEFGDARAKLRANIEAARAEEREACARICDDEAARMPDRHLSTVAADLADRIRARGDQ